VGFGGFGVLVVLQVAADAARFGEGVQGGGDAEPGDQGPRRVTRKEIEDAFAQGWVVESVEQSRYEVRPDPNDSSFRDGGPKAWLVVARRV
jgi:hypothetical protein